MDTKPVNKSANYTNILLSLKKKQIIKIRPNTYKPLVSSTLSLKNTSIMSHSLNTSSCIETTIYHLKVYKFGKLTISIVRDIKRTFLIFKSMTDR